MKKVSTLKVLALMCAVPFFANGQSAARLQMSSKNMKAEKILKIGQGEEAPMVRVAPATVRNTPKNATPKTTAATIIGSTTYDLQTNASMPRRILTYSDGKVSTVWIGSSTGDLAASDRGTRYNSFDGTAWGAAPTARLESKRVGWGNLNKITGGEIVVAHVDAVTTNTGVGTAFGTTRNAGEFLGKTWPRVGTSGNTVHAIISTSAADAPTGFAAPVYYGKSTDGGATFDTLDAGFAAAAGYDTSNHLGDIGGDSYTIDVNGDKVAILILGTTEDIVLLNSNDAGATWTRTVLREFPIKKYLTGPTDANADGIADTLLGTTSNGSVIIDNNGTIHCVWADLLVFAADSAGLNVFLTATSDYFNYWNTTDKNLVQVPTLLDADGNGSFDAGSDFTAGSTVRYGNSGYSLQPQLAIGNGTNNANFLYMTYAAVAENDTNDVGVDFRNIFWTGSADNGATWSTPFNISQTVNEENVFATCAREVGDDNKLHVAWQKDFDPGVAVQGGHTFTAADIVYESVNVATGINNSKKLNASIVAYPNPTSDVANFEVTVEKGMKAEFKLVNILGQTVNTISTELTAGVNKVSFNVSDLNAGVYTMVLTSNGKSATEKVIVK